VRPARKSPGGPVRFALPGTPIFRRAGSADRCGIQSTGSSSSVVIIIVVIIVIIIVVLNHSGGAGDRRRD
jgi:hypothetical protein